MKGQVYLFRGMLVYILTSHPGKKTLILFRLGSMPSRKKEIASGSLVKRE
jgi:hypothetical protein